MLYLSMRCWRRSGFPLRTRRHGAPPRISHCPAACLHIHGPTTQASQQHVHQDITEIKEEEMVDTFKVATLMGA